MHCRLPTSQTARSVKDDRNEKEDHRHNMQIRTFWCPVGMHNHASSRTIGACIAVLIVSPELRSRARWTVVNKPSARSADASGYAPLVSSAYLRIRRE